MSVSSNLAVSYLLSPLHPYAADKLDISTVTYNQNVCVELLVLLFTLKVMEHHEAVSKSVSFAMHVYISAMNLYICEWQAIIHSCCWSISL